MVDAAFEWASKNALLLTSEIHGEQEAKLILGDGFSLNEEEGEEQNQSMSMTCEVPRLNRLIYFGQNLWNKVRVVKTFFNKPFKW